MKKIFIGLTLIVSAASLTGCGIQEGQETSKNYPESHYVFEQEMPNGDRIQCIWAKSGYGGGPSCDFDHPIKPGS